MLHTLYDIIFPEPSISFSMFLWLVTITMTMLSDVTDVWQCDHDITLILTLSLEKKNKSNENEKKIKIMKLVSRLCISDTKSQFEIWTNHKDLEYFIKAQKLN